MALINMCVFLNGKDAAKASADKEVCIVLSTKQIINITNYDVKNHVSVMKYQEGREVVKYYFPYLVNDLFGIISSKSLEFEKGTPRPYAPVPNHIESKEEPLNGSDNDIDG